MSGKEPVAIERRIAKVSMATGLSIVLTIVLQIISVGVCLRYWGNETYGVWLAVFAAFTLLRTLDGGYGGYVGNRLNMLYHRSEKSLQVTLASSVWGVAVLGGLQLMVLALLYATDSMDLIIDSQSTSLLSSETVLALLFLTVSWILTGSYIGIVHRVMIPAGLLYQATWWSMGFQVAQFVALISAAMLGLGILRAAMLFALVQTITYIASAIYVKMMLPRYYPWWFKPSKSVGLRDLFRSIPFTLGGILQQGGNSGMIMLVSGFLGPALVPAYTTVKTLSNFWVALINASTSPLYPDVVRFHEHGDVQKLLTVNQLHWLLVGTTVNLTILIAYPFIGTVFGIWTGHNLTMDKPLLSLLLATVSLTAMSALMSTILSALNHSGFILTAAALRGGMALLLAALLMPMYGTMGLGFAVLLAEMLTLVVTMKCFFKRDLEQFGSELKISFWSWSWLSSGCVVVYMLAESLGFSFSDAIYWVAMAGVVLGSMMAWQELDAGAKIRVQALIHSASGKFSLRWW